MKGNDHATNSRNQVRCVWPHGALHPVPNTSPGAAIPLPGLRLHLAGDGLGNDHNSHTRQPEITHG